MKLLKTVALTAAGLTVAALPAVAAAHCGCHVVHHRHHYHRAVVRAAYYRPAPAAPPYAVAYDEAPAPPEIIYGAPPAYWAGPAWYGEGLYLGGYGVPRYYGGGWRGGERWHGGGGWHGGGWHGGFVGHGGHFRR